MKRLFDLTCSLIGLIFLLPVFSIITFLIWVYDFHNPFYIAPRLGKGGKTFKMVKFRSMVVNADKMGGDSTSADDNRITPIGSFIRKFKFDELIQLWNVFKGDISLVGPRPNVPRVLEIYTEEEKKLVSVRPGITDFASIVFADEGDILSGKENPDLAYEQLIRPWKGRLGVFYIENQSILLDVNLIFLTLYSIVNRKASLRKACSLLQSLGASDELVSVAARNTPLTPTPPLGSTEIVV